MDWLQKRNAPADLHKVKNPAELVASLMIAQKKDAEAASRQYGEAEKKLNRLACQTALEVFRAGRSEAPPPLAKAIGDILENAGVEMILYDGRDLTEGIQKTTDIVEWVPGSTDRETVGETLEPEIRRDGILLHQAKLSCRKAAEKTPEAAAPDSVPVQAGPGAVEAEAANEAEAEAEVKKNAAEAQPASKDAVAEAVAKAGPATEEDTADEEPVQTVTLTTVSPARIGWFQRILSIFARLWSQTKITASKEAAPNEDQ